MKQVKKATFGGLYLQFLRLIRNFIVVDIINSFLEGDKFEETSGSFIPSIFNHSSSIAKINLLIVMQYPIKIQIIHGSYIQRRSFVV